MYKEGWWYSVGLMIIVTIGLYLRFYQLDFLSPIRDEYLHLVAAKRFMIEGNFNYSRAAFLTYIVGFLFKLNGGTSLFLGRLPSVIFGTLSIIAIYFLAKKINKKVGIISGYLLAFSPLSVGLSRYIREYQFYFLFIILFLILFTNLLKKIIDLNFLKKNNIITGLLFIFITSLAGMYYLFIERVAMIYQLYLIMSIFTFIFILKTVNLKKIFMNKNFYFFIIFTMILLSIVIPIFSKNYGWLLKENNFNDKEKLYEDMMFKPDWGYRNNTLTLQWFSNSNFTKFFAITFFIMSILLFYRNKYYISIFLSFLAIYLTFLYMIDRYFAPRYIYYSIIFYIVIYSCSIFSILRLHQVFNKRLKLIYILLISIIIISFFSPVTVVNGLINEEKGSINPNSEMGHRDIEQLFEFLNRTNFDEKDKLITTNPGIFLYNYNLSFLKNESDLPINQYEYNKKTNNFIYDYGYQLFPENQTHVYSIVENYENGWIIMDKDRNRHWSKILPLKDIKSDKVNIKYLGEVGGYRGFDVYNWSYLK
jgi:hypothetical protein